MYSKLSARFTLFLGKKIMSIDYGEKYVGLATFIPGNDPYPLGFGRIRFIGQKKLISDLTNYVKSEAVDLLVLGIPIGDLLARKTREELRSGRKWFALIVILSLLGGLIGLIFRNDVIMFSFFFMAIVTSRSLRKKKNNSKG